MEQPVDLQEYDPLPVWAPAAPVSRNGPLLYERPLTFEEKVDIEKQAQEMISFQPQKRFARTRL